MHASIQNTVKRGILAVCAESTADTPAAVAALAGAFADFKARYDAKLDKQQSEIEDAHTKLAGQQYFGADTQAQVADDGVIHSFKALRTFADFKAHYSKDAPAGDKVGLSDCCGRHANQRRGHPGTELGPGHGERLSGAPYSHARDSGRYGICQQLAAGWRWRGSYGERCQVRDHGSGQRAAPGGLTQ